MHKEFQNQTDPRTADTDGDGFSAAYIHDETLIALDASRWAESSLHVAAVADEDAVGINGHPVCIALSASPA
jgi:hypothetical protein